MSGVNRLAVAATQAGRGTLKANYADKNIEAKYPTKGFSKKSKK